MNDTAPHKYEYEIDLNGDSAGAKVIRLVGQGKRVLELGPGPGSITRHLAQYSGCRVTGLEFDSEAIKKLARFCEQVYQCDLNDPAWPSVLGDHEPFDVIVAADVLEHLFDPWSTLRQMKGLLAKGGRVVVSLPHVAHSAIVACLLDENFEYREWGLLDKTHIRFFGIHDIQALFERTGLAIEDAEFVVRQPEETEFGERWKKLPKFVRDALAMNPFGTVYQVVVRAVVSDQPGSGLVLPRLKVPCSHSAEQNSNALTSSIPEPESTSSATKIRLIAFFLPQYHPIPENDLWWGKGFTEWTNVTKAMPLFDGHYQPHLPSDLGYYDLRLREVRHEQIALAKEHGIDGFCYHYYWFSGKRLLDRPLDDMLADPASEMPFCLCWANENWTRRWDAAEHEVLIAQNYGPDDDLDFINSLIPFFSDPRYIRLDGAPFFIVYRPQHLPDARKTVEIWRDHCKRVGIGDIHVCAALTHGNEDYQQFGFDSGVEFPPHNPKMRNINDKIAFYAPFQGHVMPYHRLAQSYLDRTYQSENVFRTVFPGWDNTARTHSRALVVLNGTPANYEYWLSETIRRTAKQYPEKERFVFINAWNEWAEGCHLEPDRRYGRQFLEANYRAKTQTSQKTHFEDTMIPSPPEFPSESLGHQNGQVALLLQELANRDAELAELSRSLSQHQQHIDAMLGSTSWKATAPLRAVSRTRQRWMAKLGRIFPHSSDK